ncbi:MAG TPA: hypothetical protein PL117_17160 [Accumulibacter sp.]|uniref:hypothetical protein n=1 Tax=Accumulibacter sp. TaxID=2053492 RepID=UPI002C00A0C4|nr:hypothetical protein [Accumulibacter sp.]HRF74497.1 hypothetical protein [Accumulibacter sp.]
MRNAAHGVRVAEAVAVRERTHIMTSYKRFIGFMPQPALTGDAAHPAGFAPLRGDGLGKESKNRQPAALVDWEAKGGSQAARSVGARDS